MSPGPGWLDRVAHDLRGPLMPLQTAVQLLRSGKLEPARQAELLDVIERQARQLAMMIGELDDWNRAGQGRLLGRHERIEPALLLDAAGVGAGVPVAVSGDTGELAVEGDPQRLTQLLRVIVAYLGSLGGAPSATLSVADGRLRIDLQGDAEATDNDRAALLEQPQKKPFDGGLGLQLLVARGIAEAHGGSLQVLAAPGPVRLRCELPLAPD